MTNLIHPEGAHTPGPWEICQAQNGRCVCGQIWSIPADFNIATAHYDLEELGIKIPEDQMIANAKLIAAAPDLLAAAKIAIGRLLSTEEGYEELKAAINKATS